MLGQDSSPRPVRGQFSAFHHVNCQFILLVHLQRQNNTQLTCHLIELIKKLELHIL